MSSANGVSPSYDVAVAGGGMVGAALACSLAMKGFEVALIEQNTPQDHWPDGDIDLRVSALTRASQNILSNLGAWDAMLAMRVSPYRRMHVWDAGSFGEIHFDCSEIGETDLGHIVENRVIQLALWQRLHQLSHVHLFCPNRVMRIDLPNRQLLLDDATVISAHLIVAADGRDSPVRQMAGIETRGWNYGQHALVATVSHTAPHQATAWQRFLPTGPLAFLPLNDGRSSIVWSTTPAEANRLCHLSATEFSLLLAQAIEHKLGDITSVGPRGVFPLRLQHAIPYVLEGLALTGDSAHAIHPLAGQGVNLGLLDAATLVECLCDGRASGRKPGSLRDLRRYERIRKGDNLRMQGAMDLFKRLFSNANPLLGLLRGAGLALADRITPLNHFFMYQALGLQGERPNLCKRERDL
jgi:2-octaprenylphenol hydroxylase